MLQTMLLNAVADTRLIMSLKKKKKKKDGECHWPVERLSLHSMPYLLHIGCHHIHECVMTFFHSVVSVFFIHSSVRSKYASICRVLTYQNSCPPLSLFEQ